MTTKEIVAKFGVEHFYSEDKSHYIVYPIHLQKEDALRGANSYFKVGMDRLKVYKAYRFKDTIYFSRPKECQVNDMIRLVWAVEVVK